jgi:hypothetical protein
LLPMPDQQKPSMPSAQIALCDRNRLQGMGLSLWR